MLAPLKLSVIAEASVEGVATTRKSWSRVTIEGCGVLGEE
jgi:hypothetical protein